MSEYKWPVGTPERLRSIDPGEAGRQVIDLRNALGREPCADDLLKDSEEPFKPLHRAFEWDDARAADAYRFQQAERILRYTLRIERISHPAPAPRTLAVTPIRGDAARGYGRDATGHFASPLRRTKAVKDVLREIDSCKHTCVELLEQLGLPSDPLKEEFQELRQYVDRLTTERLSRQTV